MSHRHVVPVDRAGGIVAGFARRQMGHDLVAEEVEIHPFVAGAAFRATEQVPVEAAGVGQRCDGKRKMKRTQCGHGDSGADKGEAGMVTEGRRPPVVARRINTVESAIDNCVHLLNRGG
jgi:hypothetical protein